MEEGDFIFVGMVGAIALIIGIGLGYVFFTERTVINIYSNATLYLTSEEDCENIIAQKLSKAKSSIYVMQYSFTIDRFANILIESKDFGLDVHVLLDHRQVTKHSKYDMLREAGVDVKIYPNALYHRVIVIDGVTVITGSFDFSNSAKDTVSNILVLEHPNMAQDLIEEYEQLTKKLP